MRRNLVHRPSVLLAHFSSIQLYIYISDTAPLLYSLFSLCRFFRQNNLTSCKCPSCSKVVSAALQFPFCTSFFFLWSDNLIDVHTHTGRHMYLWPGRSTLACVCVAEVKLLNRPLKNDTSSMRVKGPKGSPESRSGMQPAVNTWIIGEGLHYPPAPLPWPCNSPSSVANWLHRTMQPEEALHTAPLIGFNFDIV